MERRRLPLLRPALIAGLLLGANLLLAAGLAAAALRPRPVLVLPSARSAEELLPGDVPAAAAREFALRYVLHFDNFTPGTLDATEQVLRSMVAPGSWSRAKSTFERRRKLVEEGRLSSQVVPLSAEIDGLRVSVRAVRRIFISDRLSRRSEPVYRLVLEKQPPTEANPYGLGVVSQEIEEAAEEGGR
jgi:hypothetical protein